MSSLAGSFTYFSEDFRKLFRFSNFPKNTFLSTVLNFHLFKRKSKSVSRSESSLYSTCDTFSKIHTFSKDKPSRVAAT